MFFHAFTFQLWKDILPVAPEEARDLVAGPVMYWSTLRLSALEVSACKSCHVRVIVKILLNLDTQALNYVLFSDA